MNGCKMTLPSIFHFISFYFFFFGKYEHYYSCTIRTEEKYFYTFVQYSYQMYRVFSRKLSNIQCNGTLTLSPFTITDNIQLVVVFQGRCSVALSTP